VQIAALHTPRIFAESAILEELLRAKHVFFLKRGMLMSQLVVLTVAAALVGMLRGRRNRPTAVPELMAAKVKNAAKKVERSAASVEAAIERLMATVADEQRVGLLPRQPC
jgi:hypothetical protein